MNISGYSNDLKQPHGSQNNGFQEARSLNMLLRLDTNYKKQLFSNIN
jgi:hypothetical protein